MTGVQDRGLRSYVSEPNRGRRSWKRNRDAQKPTYANRRRIRGNRGKRLLRQRGEKVERGFAHLLLTGGLRRVHVRRQEEIRKTDADSGCHLQPRASHAQAVRDRHPSGPAGSRRGTSRTRMPRQHRRLAHDSPLLPSVWPSRPDCRLFKPQDPP